jgi:hypothetical protein
MAAKTTLQKAKRKNTNKTSKPSPPPVYATSTLSVVTQNLFNMIAVTAVSGTVQRAVARHSADPAKPA